MSCTSQDPLLPLLAETVVLLLQYVDHRPDDATADEDVKVLESAAFLLQQVQPEDRGRLIELLGREQSRAAGLLE